MPDSAPPSPLARAFDRRSDKRAWVDWVFERIARRYDLGNDVMSLGWHARWKRRLVELADVRPGQRVLDLACGTGDTTALLAERAGLVVGADPSPTMLALAGRKLAGGRVRLVRSRAERLPFAAQSFDRVTCTYAGRGFEDLPAVLREAFRVLRPGGTLWNLDFGRPERRWVDRFFRGWLAGSGALLGLALHGHPLTYVYIPASMARYPGPRWLHTELERAGFRPRTLETTLGLMAFSGGTKPEESA